MLVYELNGEWGGLGLDMNHETFPDLLSFGEIDWIKAYASFTFQQPNSQIAHVVSIQYIKFTPYYYDGYKFKGSLYQNPDLLPKDALMNHVVYIRKPEERPAGAYSITD